MLNRVMLAGNGASDTLRELPNAIGDAISRILQELTAIRSAVSATTPVSPYQENIVFSFDSVDTPIYNMREQLRLSSLKVYTAAAGVYVFVRGTDTSMKFLSTVNGQVSVISGSDEELVLTAGLPITITGPGAWYATAFAKPGNPGGNPGTN